MPFQYPNPGANLVNEYLASSIPFLTSSSFLSASSAIEISFPYVASFVNVYNSSPTGSLAVAFAAPGINTSAHFDVAPGTSESFPVRCTSVFLGASAGAAQSYSLAAGLTGIQVRDNNFYVYSPADEGNLIGEWDARDKLYSDVNAINLIKTSGDRVAYWRDKAGGHPAIQASTSAQPIWNENGFKTGYPAVIFDGVDDLLGALLPPLYTSSGTYFIVTCETQITQYPTPLLINENIGQPMTNKGITLYHQNSTTAIIIGDSSRWRWYSSGTTSATSVNSRNLYTVSWGNSSTKTIVRKNKINSTLTTGIGPASTNFSVSLYLVMGGDILGTAAKMSIAHIILYPTQLTIDAIQRVESYLSDQWGLGL